MWFNWIQYFLSFCSYEWSKDDFELGCPLGRGKFGRVYVAREKKTHFMIALKVLFKSEIIKGRIEKQIGHEIEIQSRLRYADFTQISIELHIWVEFDLQFPNLISIVSQASEYFAFVHVLLWWQTHLFGIGTGIRRWIVSSSTDVTKWTIHWRPCCSLYLSSCRCTSLLSFE